MKAEISSPCLGRSQSDPGLTGSPTLCRKGGLIFFDVEVTIKPGNRPDRQRILVRLSAVGPRAAAQVLSLKLQSPSTRTNPSCYFFIRRTRFVAPVTLRRYWIICGLT